MTANQVENEVSESKSVRIQKCQNKTLSESGVRKCQTCMWESVRKRKCQKKKSVRKRKCLKKKSV